MATVTNIDEAKTQKKSRGRPKNVGREVRKGLPIIDASGGGLHDAFDESIKAIAASNNLYNKDGVLLKIEGGELAALTEAVLRVELSRIANFVKNELVIDPPADIAKAIWVSNVYPSVRKLQGVTQHPVLIDNTLSNEGFDEKTGLFGNFAASDYAVPEKPNEQDKSAALKLLLEPLQTFDLDEAHDHGAALAAMMTAVCRPVLRTAPLFLVSAPLAGAGKGLLARCFSLVATTREVAACTLGENHEETKKEIISRLASAKPVIFFDELAASEIDSPDLRTLATSAVFGGRILGKSQDVDLSTRTLVLMTGNNATPSSDTARRVVEIRLKPACETPSLRSFDFDPIEFTLKNRSRIIGAVLTIQRFYANAGYPKIEGVPSTGSFEDWDNAVRFPIIFAMGQNFDPAKRMQDGIKCDPRKNELINLLAAWKSALGNEKITAGEVIEKVTALVTGSKEKALRAAIVEAVGSRGGDISPRAFGKFLSRSRDRIAGGLMLIDGALLNGRQRWQVVQS